MNSPLPGQDPHVIAFLVGFAVTIGLAWLLSYTRRGQVRPWLWGRRKVRGPRPPVAALDPALPARVAVMKLRASRGQRVATFLCDVVFLVLLMLAGMMLEAVLLRLVFPEDAPQGLLGVLRQLLGTDRRGGEFLSTVTVLGGVLSIFLYYVVLEAKFGRTAGKWVAGTRVVDLDGCPITLGQAVGRTLCRRLPWEPVSLLFLNDKYGGRSAWHDAIPSTVVISTRQGGTGA